MTDLTTRDGLRLHLEQWPAERAPRGTVLIVHGLGEHIGRYAHVVERLRAAGWAVAGYDQRGHGRSEGRRGVIAAPDSLFDDLARVIDLLRAQGSAPLVLLGHSLGGLLAGRFVAEALAPQPATWSRPVDALVMSSPALDAGMNAGQKLLLAILAPLAPRLALNNGLKPQWISRDPAVVAAYMADPLVHDRVCPALVRCIVDGGAVVRSRAAQWTVPTLLTYAGADRCVAPGGSDAFAAAAPAALVQSRCWDGLAHEIFNEPEREAVLDDLVGWLGGRFAALA
jgi:alpha-beta hydrolase superfamily lysophospholipase